MTSEHDAEEAHPEKASIAGIDDESGEGQRRGLFGEILAWVGSSGKWWLIPILLGLLLVGLLVTVGSSVLAPFIYPLF